MKSILVPVYEHAGLRFVLEHAALVGEAFGSHIEGFALSPFAPLAAVDPLAVAMALEAGPSAEARQLFEEVLGRRAATGKTGAEAMSVGWREEASRSEDFLGSYSRAFDLIVLGRPSPRDGPRMSTLEAALFESGRPVLVAPPRAPSTLGTAIVIAWNGSSETARAIAFAMPFLRRADQVAVLTIEGGTVPGGPSGDRVARSLRSHGISARSVSARPGKASVGEAILIEAAGLGCDLLIKGAYTQSRVRQMIFGGPSEHLLWNATLPLLMAH